MWGRLENESGLTASNVAKYDALHSMVVFKEHPPSHWNKVHEFSRQERVLLDCQTRKCQIIC